LPVAMLVIETAFSNHESALAQRSQRFSKCTVPLNRIFLD